MSNKIVENKNKNKEIKITETGPDLDLDFNLSDSFGMVIQSMQTSVSKLNGQLWEECPRCGEEPVYISLNFLCEKCG